MRAKKLEAITVCSCRSANESINNILYNLAFSPKIRYIDVSNNSATNLADFVDNIGKILSISGSIEHLVLSNNLGLYEYLSLDFYKALGENSTLQSLCLDNAVITGSSSSSQNLGRAIAINAYKKGALKHLYLDNIFHANLDPIFFESMYYTNKIIEEWYGDNSKAAKMGGEDLHKVYANNIETLDISGAKLSKLNFLYEKYEKQQAQKMPSQRMLFTEFPNLKHLNLSRTLPSKGFFEMLKALYNLGIYEKQAGEGESREVTCKLETLDLSNNKLNKVHAKVFKDSLCKMTTLKKLLLNVNKLGVSGAYAVNSALKQLTGLQVLDLYANLIDVDGARDLAKVIESNTSLE